MFKEFLYCGGLGWFFCLGSFLWLLCVLLLVVSSFESYRILELSPIDKFQNAGFCFSRLLELLWA